MTRHPLRWDSLLIGLFFLAVAANWAVRERDLLTPRELTLTAAGALILLGAIGIAATVRRGRPSPPVTTSTPEGNPDEEADPQP